MVKKIISIALGGTFCFLLGVFLLYSLRNFSTFTDEYGIPIALDTFLLFSFLFAAVFFFIDPFVAIYGWPQLIFTMFVAICNASFIIIGGSWVIKRLGE